MRLAKIAFFAVAISVTRVSADVVSDAIRQGRFDAALRLTNEELRNRPGDPRLLTARGLALAGLKRTAESLTVFEGLLKLHPAFLPALKGAAQTSYAARDRRAGALLKRLLAVDPNDVTAHRMAAVLAYEAGDFASAVAEFEAGQVSADASTEAYSIYGTSLTKLGRARQALDVFETLSGHEPGNAAILRSLAAAQALSSEPERAAETLSRAIALAPGDEQSYVDLAALYLLADAGDNALPVVQAGLAQLPKSARLFGLRGVIESGNGLYSQAEKDFERANALDSARQYGAAGLGVLLTDSGRAGEAAGLLRRRVQKNPSDATLNYLLAQALVRDGAEPGSREFQDAEDALRRANKSNPNYAAARIALAKLYSQAERTDLAIDELQAALRVDANNSAALNLLGGLLRRQGRGAEALEVFHRLRTKVIPH